MPPASMNSRLLTNSSRNNDNVLRNNHRYRNEVRYIRDVTLAK